MSETRTAPTTETGHLAAMHPTLRAAYVRAVADYVRLYPSRRRPVVFQSWRPQLDCSRVRGACSSNSKHSRAWPAEAIDVDAGADWSKSSDPHGYASDFARLMQRDRCIEWGGRYRTPDYPHFEANLAAGCDAPGSMFDTDTARAAVLAAGAAVVLLLVTR